MSGCTCHSTYIGSMVHENETQYNDEYWSLSKFCDFCRDIWFIMHHNNRVKLEEYLHPKSNKLEVEVKYIHRSGAYETLRDIRLPLLKMIANKDICMFTWKILKSSQSYKLYRPEITMSGFPNDYQVCFVTIVNKRTQLDLDLASDDDHSQLYIHRNG